MTEIRREKIQILLRPDLKLIIPNDKFPSDEQEHYKSKWACSREQLHEKREISERWRLVRSYRKKWCEQIDMEGYKKYPCLWDEVYYEDYIKSRLVWRALKRSNTKRNIMRGRMRPKSRRRKNNGRS